MFIVVYLHAYVYSINRYVICAHQWNWLSASSLACAYTLCVTMLFSDVFRILFYYHLIRCFLFSYNQSIIITHSNDDDYNDDDDDDAVVCSEERRRWNGVSEWVSEYACTTQWVSELITMKHGRTGVRMRRRRNGKRSSSRVTAIFFSSLSSASSTSCKFYVFSICTMIGAQKKGEIAFTYIAIVKLEIKQMRSLCMWR